MTDIEYRNDPAQRKELLEALQMPAVIQAFAILKAQGEGEDARLDAPEIVSVRLMSQRAARDAFVRNLYQMTQPVPLPETPEPENFGTNFTVDQFEELVPQPQTTEP